VEFWGKTRRPPDARNESDIRFLREQDGPPEQAFKAGLVADVLNGGPITRAYLACVEFRDRNTHEVALCLRGAEDPALVHRISSKFAETFGRDVHLDICFVSEAQEEELQRVCKPFFRNDR
jgi:hypothetical protein